MVKSLAEIAIDEGLVSRHQVVEAAADADAEGMPLVAALVGKYQLDEVALVAAVRRQTRVPLTDPATLELDPDALRELQRAVCQRLRVLPLAVSVFDPARPRRLRLAMADPTDTVAVAEVEHLTGCRVEATIMPLSAIEEMVELGYRGFVTEVMARQQVAPTGARGKPVTGAPAPEAAQPTTLPYHRISDEAHVTLRHQALLELLVEKRLISEDEYEERVRQLMKQRDEEP